MMKATGESAQVVCVFKVCNPNLLSVNHCAAKAFTVLTYSNDCVEKRVFMSIHRGFT